MIIALQTLQRAVAIAESPPHELRPLLWKKSGEGRQEGSDA
jgi:hypothetical protein